MTGRILIVESGTNHRILLRGRLESAHYEVATTGSMAQARARIEEDPPDLVLMDVGENTEGALALCAALRASAVTAMLPIIALAWRPAADLRLAALKSGADDILDKQGSGTYLLARIRSLLRARDATQELGLRGEARRALGLADAAAAFVPAGRVAIVTDRADALPRPLAQLAMRLPGGVAMVDPAGDLGAAGPGIDLYVIDAGSAVPEGGEVAGLFRLIADIQSRRPLRLARTLVVLGSGAETLSEMALDLGADDLVPDTIGTEEIAFRVRTLLRRKNQADRLRDTYQSGIEAALTDPLTGLHNRRYAMSELGDMVERAAAADRTLAVMILDIDHFKRINDGHGHAAGDAVLREVARRLRANLRAVDLLARIGGEEFLVAMPDTTPELARAAADRLRLAVEDRGFDLGPDGARGARRLTVTISAGVAVGLAGRGGERAVADLMDRADRALYEAKSAGRNTVAVTIGLDAA